MTTSSVGPTSQICGHFLWTSIAGRREGRPLGFHIWFVQGDVAHSHLSALTEECYDLRAGYALMLKAIEMLTGKMSLLNDAGGGGRPDDDDGLTSSKADGLRPVHPSYLCRKIFDHAAYRTLTDPEKMDRDAGACSRTRTRHAGGSAANRRISGPDGGKRMTTTPRTVTGCQQT